MPRAIPFDNSGNLFMKRIILFISSLICLMALAGCDKTPPHPVTSGQPLGESITRWLAETSDGIALQNSEHYRALRKLGKSHNEALAIMRAAPVGKN